MVRSQYFHWKSTGLMSATCSFGKQDNVKGILEAEFLSTLQSKVITENKIKWFMISAEWF